MYCPEPFRWQDEAEILAAIEAAPLGLLMLNGALSPEVTPLPLLPGRDGAGGLWLEGHLALANPMAAALRAAGPETPPRMATVLWLGPQGYVSPGWYESKQRHGKVVPTWNYQAIEARGAITPVLEALEAEAILTRLTALLEQTRAAPWAVSDAPERYRRAQISQILAFRIRVTDLQGKRKASQNREPGDRAGVIAGFEAEGRPDLARLVPPATAK